MTNEVAYRRLLERRCSQEGAIRLLTYAYHAQIVGGWQRLFINSPQGSEGIKYLAMEVFRDADIDPMAITFPQRLTGKPPFGAN